MSFFHLPEALQVWEGMKDSVRQIADNRAIVREQGQGGPDYSFITPTLLALGKCNDGEIEELMNVLGGNPTLLLNISGKPISVLLRSRLKNQVLDAPWSTPGQFTQCPSLDSVFAQCYSVKSWLDLRSDHVAIVHCSNGRSRTGILIACLLKYIGAFENSAHAFGFFCSARVQNDIKPNLAPSYRMLFDNIDKTVDTSGYPNRKPLHLKSIAISGLPVDEIPCVELWDMTGLVFNSHNGWKSSNKCTWSSEYGDGFFRVTQDILGDFSVMCRFGGHHAMTRDKTTLIFKYQNNTAFMPCDVVELKRQNVDVNPDYGESLDVELFTVHLMFEKPLCLVSPNTPSRISSSDVLPSYKFNNRDAFELGLDEISKCHFVEPESNKNTSLSEMGYPDQYITVALQLSDNDIDVAAELITNMKLRAQELDQLCPPSANNSGKHLSHVAAADKFISDGVDSTPAMAVAKKQLKSATAIDLQQFESPEQSPSSGDNFSFVGTANHGAVASPLPPTFVAAPLLGQAGVTDYSTLARRHELLNVGGADGVGPSSALESLIEVDQVPTCPTCKEDNVLKREQLVCCLLCCCYFHSGCIANGRRIPFTLKTPKERANRDKYLNKYYKGWRCVTCIDVVIPDAAFGASASVGSTGFEGLLNVNTSVNPPQPPMQQPVAENALSPKSKNKHEQAALLMRLLASNGITLESLLTMSEEKQREVLVAAASLSQNNAVEASVSTTKSAVVSSIANNSASSISSSNASNTSSNVSNSSSNVSNASSNAGNTSDPRASLMNMLANRASNPDEAPKPPLQPEPEQKESAAPPPDPKYAKYFKMLKVGLPKPNVAQKMVSDGVVDSINKALDILDLNSLAAANAVASEASAPEKSTEGMVAVGEHDSFRKYFKMLQVGLPLDVVKVKMQQDGLNPMYLDKKPTELIPIVLPKVVAPTSEKSDSSAASSAELVAISEHPSYSKFFRMIKMGLPRDAVKAKMKLEGFDESYLDKSADEKIPIAKPDDSPQVAVSEHPKYSKYFKMLKVGLPREVIKTKMQSENVDPTYLDKNPDEMVPLNDEKAAKAVEKTSPLVKKPIVRKKKLYWKALDANKVGRDSLWAESDDKDEITLDVEEFNQLFIESESNTTKVKTEVEVAPKKMKINLIDMKRGQNAGIALARIKYSYTEIRKKIERMEDESFTADQLHSLEEYLPTIEESGLLKKFKGDVDALGQAEKYMLEMLGFKSASQRIRSMIFKQQFKSRIAESKAILSKIENACDDVKMSLRLKKVLKTILKVGNQMNDGDDNIGFTLDSLLKLQSAKAFDKKTSILQYVIILIYRNDENCLLFPEDLSRIHEASRITLDSITAERTVLGQGLDTCNTAIAEFLKEDTARGVSNSTESMAVFISKAKVIMSEFEVAIDNLKAKFSSVLAYFGEEPSMTSQDFFSTLAKFVEAFNSEKAIVDRMRKAEARKNSSSSSSGEGIASSNSNENLSGAAKVSKRNSIASMPSMLKVVEGESGDHAGGVASSTTSAVTEASKSPLKDKMKRRASTNY